MKPSITVECELFGALKSAFSGRNQKLRLPAKTTYQQLLTDHLHFSAQHLRYLVIIENETPVKNLHQPIPDGAKLKILLPLGGG